ncbi:MAG: EAL domain-containing protein, partial [Alphaproteobacteria bacterium]
FYQPIVNGSSGEIETFEALIRWHHPERGIVSPAEFIPLAERSDLIVRIGAWVIETACAAAVNWPRPWRVSINVSPSQLRQSDVPGTIAAALGRHGLDPARLMVEITESVLIQDAEAAIAVLTYLRGLGVRLALDDFGTGYSSLSYLHGFKFDKLKIDQSFVRRLGEHTDTLTIVRAIVNLGHNLGMQVTVEGVETAEQLAILRGLDCDQMQGYLFGRPAPGLAVSDTDRARVRALFAPPLIRAVARDVAGLLAASSFPPRRTARTGFGSLSRLKALPSVRFVKRTVRPKGDIGSDAERPLAGEGSGPLPTPS